MALSALRKFRKPKQIELEDYLAKLLSKGLHPDGTPILDPTPLAPPIGYIKAPSMFDTVRDLIRGENLKREALAAGMETFEEADDFDIEDEKPQLRSIHEHPEDQPSARELLAAGKASLASKQKPAERKEGGPGSKNKPEPVPPAPQDPDQQDLDNLKPEK